MRLVYTAAGQPTATLLNDDKIIVDYKLFWITCEDMQEANYLLAIINSDTLAAAVNPLHDAELGGQYAGFAKAPMEVADTGV